jgi:hypothetical protein
MSDPLSLIRKVVLEKGSFDYADGFYVVAGYRLAEDTKTAFKRSVKGKFLSILLL